MLEEDSSLLHCSSSSTWAARRTIAAVDYHRPLLVEGGNCTCQ